jgi:phenylalanyl-tRNA synthetase alpha chain
MFMKQKGKLHPLSQTIRQISDIFIDMGFEIADGPYMEDQWHNFDALNVPQDHPARDMQDTFFVREKSEDGRLKVLRTHTSSVQIRFMEEFIKKGKTPPFKIIAPGKVFRNEATDATHEAQFHQIEGLVVGGGVSLAHLKGTLERFLEKFYGRKIEFRFRPGYFPFVEPGIEIDLKFGDKWMEVLGAGMVHPQVLENVGIDSKKYSGFAFGVGIDRLTMMKYNIKDVRYFYQGDVKLHDAIREQSEK